MREFRVTTLDAIEDIPAACAACRVSLQNLCVPVIVASSDVLLSDGSRNGIVVHLAGALRRNTSLCPIRSWVSSEFLGDLSGVLGDYGLGCLEYRLGFLS